MASIEDVDSIRQIVRKHVSAIYKEFENAGCAYTAESSVATAVELLTMHIAACSDCYEEGMNG